MQVSRDVCSRWWLLEIVLILKKCNWYIYGPGSSVAIPTEPQAARSGDRILVEWDFPPVQTGPGAHPDYCTLCTQSFQGVKDGRGVLLTTHPLLVQWSWKGRAISLPTLWATTGSVTGTLYFTLLTSWIHTRTHSHYISTVTFSESRKGSKTLWSCSVHFSKFISSQFRRIPIFIVYCHSNILQVPNPSIVSRIWWY